MNQKVESGRSPWNRRKVLTSLAAAAAVGTAPPILHSATKTTSGKTIAGTINPRWYGFNLMEYFSTDPDWMKYFPYKDDGLFPEDDFRWMSGWGFNWVRLPMDYRFWTNPSDPMKIDERKVEPIDRAIRLGEKYGVHVNIGLHRAPGECILDGMDEKATGIHITPEKLDVYRDRNALDAFVYQWSFFAHRYKGISSDRVSFNLVNEPIDRAAGSNDTQGRRQYARVARAAVATIRREDPGRLIVTDGYPGGGSPIPELFDAGILQSCHDYTPFQLTHYRAEWVRPANKGLPVPTWPLKDSQGQIICDKERIEAQYRPWSELARQRIPIHFGETGCNRYTSPDVAHAWYRDTLQMIGGLKAGWALWNFRGPNGILDTNRPGTRYRNWYGHNLDFELLQILQANVKA